MEHGKKGEKVKKTRTKGLQVSHAFLRHHGPVLFVLASRVRNKQRDVWVGYCSIAAERQSSCGRGFLLPFALVALHYFATIYGFNIFWQ